MEANIISPTLPRRERRRYSPEQIAEYLEAQPNSGLSIAAFCKRHGVSVSKFYGWKRRYRRAMPAQFQEVAWPQAGSSFVPWIAELVLPGGLVIRLSAQADLARLRPWLAELLRP
jgi:transposase-like protein